ncbi:MAG: hypothetical protein ISR52_08405 [Rhodospirillales bacterium]|nr:hypothetical protein [Rhodospirillales bacterium]
MPTLIRPLMTAAALALMTLSPALALEDYPPAQQQQFLDWCTGAKSASESTCSCTLKRLAQTVPPAALASFLAGKGSFSLSASSVAAGAAVTEALAACSK